MSLAIWLVRVLVAMAGVFLAIVAVGLLVSVEIETENVDCGVAPVAAVDHELPACERAAAAVATALEKIQVRLTGATPESHYLWDSHAGRPKSEDEISDYLANELERELTARGVIVNREVQVRRNRPSGIGERPTSSSTRRDPNADSVA